jgi:hypothetical protein
MTREDKAFLKRLRAAYDEAYKQGLVTTYMPPVKVESCK